MISAERQRNFPGFKRLDYQLGMFGAGGRDLFQIFGVGVAFFFLFGNGDSDVTAVLDFVAEGLESRLKPSHADCRRSHVDTASGLSQVERNTDDANLSGSDAGGTGCRGHRVNRRGLKPSSIEYRLRIEPVQHSRERD